MSLVTIPVLFQCYQQSGDPYADVSIEASLTRVETDGGFVLSLPVVSGVTGEDGSCLLNLWPNSRGTTRSQYKVTTLFHGSMIDEYLISVPEAASGDWPVLADTIVNSAQYPEISDEQQAALDASASVARDAALAAGTWIVHADANNPPVVPLWLTVVKQWETLSLVTIPVLFQCYQQNGTPLVGVSIEASLTRVETDGGFVLNTPVVVGETVADGSCLLCLWPNSRGSAGSQYKVSALFEGIVVDEYLITVPEAEYGAWPVLARTIRNSAPYPEISDAQQAVIDAQALVVRATAKANISTANALLTAADVETTTANAEQVNTNAGAAAAAREAADAAARDAIAAASTLKVSADADNRLTKGSDAGLYVPEIVSDPLAYYILSKS